MNQTSRNQRTAMDLMMNRISSQAQERIEIANNRETDRGVERDVRVERVERVQRARPQFRAKVVCELECLHCKTRVCDRGMKAILLADMAVELFSTDTPPESIIYYFWS